MDLNFVADPLLTSAVQERLQLLRIEVALGQNKPSDDQRKK